MITIPHTVLLKQNYPNPFNPITTIEFQIANSEFIILEVFNNLGQKVVTLLDKKMTAGIHHVQFDASELPSVATAGILPSTLRTAMSEKTSPPIN